MKKLILFVVLFGAASAAFYFYLQKQELTLSLSETVLQERLSEAFPVDKHFLVLLTLRLSDPEVSLIDGSDRLHYRMNASLTVPAVARPLAGAATVSGALLYDAETRNLYLDQSRVEDLDIEGVPSQYRVAVREAANLAVRQQLDRRPVYTVEEELFEGFPGVVAVRDVRVKDGQLEVSFGLAERFWTRLLPGDGAD